MTPGVAGLLYFAAVIVIPAAVISLLTLLCAKRGAPRLFLYSVLLLTCISALAIPAAMGWMNPYSGDPVSWHDIPGALLSWAPIFLLPSAFVWPCVKGSASRGWIPIRAMLG